MAMEIERKYLVKQERWHQLKKHGSMYKQGYLIRTENKTVRIRLIEGDKGYITIKGETKGVSREEYEYSIPEKDAQELLDKYCDAIVTKKRHKIKVESKLWEVDEFMDDNEGLIIAEIELNDEKEEFALPEWIDKEVTGDARYYNSELSVHPYKKWNNEKEKRDKVFKEADE